MGERRKSDRPQPTATSTSILELSVKPPKRRSLNDRTRGRRQLFWSQGRCPRTVSGESANITPKASTGILAESGGFLGQGLHRHDTGGTDAGRGLCVIGERALACAGRRHIQLVRGRGRTALGAKFVHPPDRKPPPKPRNAAQPAVATAHETSTTGWRTLVRCGRSRLPAQNREVHT